MGQVSVRVENVLLDRAEPGLLLEHTVDPTGLRAIGEVDLSSHELWQHGLAGAPAADDSVCLDLSELTFIDVRGVALLVAEAQRRERSRWTVRQPPPMVPRMLRLCWPAQSSITVDGRNPMDER